MVLSIRGLFQMEALHLLHLLHIERLCAETWITTVPIVQPVSVWCAQRSARPASKGHQMIHQVLFWARMASRTQWMERPSIHLCKL
eukprot:symbB.v1.2.031060.t1/scaffold3566.1/size54023/3